MISAAYKAAASLASLEQWQTSISTNIASATVPGYKSSQMTFEGVTSGSTRVDETDFSSSFSTSSMPAAGLSLNMAQGNIRNTGNPLDVAISGPGFFQVQLPSGGTAYTRNGEFQLDADGILVTSRGMPVLGQSGPISVELGDGKISISRDGTVSQGGNEVAKLALFDLGESTAMARAAGGFFLPTPGAPNPVILENPNVAQGFIEASNVSPLREMVNLITVGRAYEASRKIINSQSEDLQNAIQTLGNPQPS